MASGMQYALVVANSSTVSLVAAVAGQRVQVISYNICIAGAGICTIQEITSDTDLLVAQSGATPSVITNAGSREAPLFACAVGEGLEVVASTAVAMTVAIAYIQGPL